MNTFRSAWYVVHTQTHGELKASEHLQRQGFITYLPRYLRRRRHARKIDTVAAPLFPRYLFVAIDRAAQRWRCIHSTVGVSRLLCNGEDPIEVPLGVVEGLRLREDERGFINLGRRTSFSSGDKVQVVDGAFSSCLGHFERATDGERVAILLDMLGRKVRIVLSEEAVVAA